MTDARPVVVDADPGSDDALALLLLAASERTELAAVTAVAGNTTLERAVANAVHTLEVAGRPDVPVHPGADGPLVAESETAEDVHGQGGLGALHPDPDRPASDVDAVEALRDPPGEAPTLLCLGPLTNVGRALERDPDLGERYADVVVMAGACGAAGNVTPAAEFNAWFDPHAARRVLDGLDVTLVDWGVAERAGTLDDGLLDRVAAADTERAEFATDALAVSREHDRRHGGTVVADALAATITLAPDVATRTREAGVTVDDREGLTRGFTAADPAGSGTTVVEAADGDRFRAAIEATLRGGDPDAALANPDRALLQRARRACDGARVPETGYEVGAALRTADGTVFAGCNVEGDGAAVHAEAAALSAALAAGHDEFEALAVSSGAEDGVAPCEDCRALLRAHCAATLRVSSDRGTDRETWTLVSLPPP